MQTGTILDTLPKRSLFSKHRPATALDLAVADLQTSERELLEQKRKAEYHAAMVVMFTKRISRLRDDIKRLSKDTKVNPSIHTGGTSDEEPT